MCRNGFILQFLTRILLGSDFLMFGIRSRIRSESTFTFPCEYFQMLLFRFDKIIINLINIEL